MGCKRVSMESLNQWIRSVIPEGKRRLALQNTTTNTVVPALASTFYNAALAYTCWFYSVKKSQIQTNQDFRLSIR